MSVEHGHLILSVNLGNHLATHHDVRITIFQVTTEKLRKIPLHHQVKTVELLSIDICYLEDLSTKVIT